MQLLMNELFGEDDRFVDQEDRTIIGRQSGYSISPAQDKQLASSTKRERRPIKKGASIKAQAPPRKKSDRVGVDDDDSMGRR